MVFDHILNDGSLVEIQRRAAYLADTKGGILATEIVKTLSMKYPITHHVYFRLVHLAEAMNTFSDALSLDFQLAIRMTARPDFTEGFRAVLVDKTNDTRWERGVLQNLTMQ